MKLSTCILKRNLSRDLNFWNVCIHWTDRPMLFSWISIGIDRASHASPRWFRSPLHKANSPEATPGSLCPLLLLGHSLKILEGTGGFTHTVSFWLRPKYLWAKKRPGTGLRRSILPALDQVPFYRHPHRQRGSNYECPWAGGCCGLSTKVLSEAVFSCPCFSTDLNVHGNEWHPGGGVLSCLSFWQRAIMQMLPYFMHS